MKTKLILLTLMSVAVIWGCGKKKASDETTKVDTAMVAPQIDTLIHVISLPDLGIQSLLRNPKDSTKKEWRENMSKLKNHHKHLGGKNRPRLMMLSTCCQCIGGCCLCSKDSTKASRMANVLLVAPKEIKSLDLISESKPTKTIALEMKEIDSLNVFTLKHEMASGKYFLRMKGDFIGEEMKCHLEIRSDAVELLPGK